MRRVLNAVTKLVLEFHGQAICEVQCVIGHRICKFLEPYFQTTKKQSGSKYVSVSVTARMVEKIFKLFEDLSVASDPDPTPSPKRTSRISNRTGNL